jgi:hypothetical protein
LIVLPEEECEWPLHITTIYLEDKPNYGKTYSEDPKTFHIVPDSIVLLIGRPCFGYENEEEYIQDNQHDNNVEYLHYLMIYDCDDEVFAIAHKDEIAEQDEHEVEV